MGRKLGEAIVILISLIFMGLIFASFNPSFASDTSSSNFRIFVHMQPATQANGSDGWFFEGSDVRVKLEMYDVRENPQTVDQTHPPVKIIDFKSAGYKILYVWDNLDTSKVTEYAQVFQPLEGSHYLFAYAVDNSGVYQTPATKFYIQYRFTKTTAATYTNSPMQNVYVSQEDLRRGGSNVKLGVITEEATSTTKISSAPSQTLKSPYATNNENTTLKKASDFLKKLLSEKNNIWIVLLVVGLSLLLVARLFIRKK